VFFTRAEILADIIQAGWTEQAISTKFFEAKKRVEAIIKAVDPENASEMSEEHYRRLEARCAKRLKGAITDELLSDLFFQADLQWNSRTLKLEAS
jgi:hypothetical protein